MELFRHQPLLQLTIRQISKKTGINYAGTYRTVQQLLKQGILNLQQIIIIQIIQNYQQNLLVMIYLGFLMAESRVIPLWHSPLIPVIFLSYSLAFGGALTAILYPITGIDYSIVFVTKLLLLTITSTLFLILVHLMVLGSSNKTARRSTELMIKGELKPMFVGGVIIVGLIIPLIITGISQIVHRCGSHSLRIHSRIGGLSH